MWIMTAQGWVMIGPRVFTPAPRDGSFLPQTIAEAQHDCNERIKQFQRDVKLWQMEQLPLEQIHRAFRAPMFGAFGERL